MSVNFSQNPQYDKKFEHNFGAINVQDATNNIQHVAPKEQMSMLENMNMPTNGKEFVEWSPYFATAVGASIGISKLTKIMSCSLKNPKATIEQSFQNSVIAKTAEKMDNFVEPALKKIFPVITKTKGFISSVTPKFIKDIAKSATEKFHIGSDPVFPLAKGQIRGLTLGAAEGFVGELKKLDPTQLNQLGIDMARISGDAKTAVTQVVQAITKKGLNVGQVQQIAGKNFIPTLNTARAFMTSNNKTGISKWLQKIFMYNAEGAGGGVVGGAALGIIMNSIFLAGTIKRTIQAPWGDKFSTFMEGAMCDFCGGMIINCVLAPRLTYKLLGLKHLDKTAAELSNMKNLRASINSQKANYEEAHKIIKMLQKGSAGEGLWSKFKRILSKTSFEDALEARIKNFAKASGENLAGSPDDILKGLNSFKNKTSTLINSGIDNLVKARKFKSNGFWKNLIYRPVHWIGSFFNVGLENVPTKISTGTIGSNLKIALHKCSNFLKGTAGFPIRFILVTAVVGGFMMKFMAKFSHTVFGRPQKCYYDDGSEKKQDNISFEGKNQQQNPYKINMDMFSEYTKATAALRAAQNPPVARPYNTKNRDDFIKSTLASQKEKADNDKKYPNKKDISPATYIPTVSAPPQADQSISGKVDLMLADGEKLMKYTDTKLGDLQSNKSPYNF